MPSAKHAREKIAVPAVRPGLAADSEDRVPADLGAAVDSPAAEAAASAGHDQAATAAVVVDSPVAAAPVVPAARARRT